MKALEVEIVQLKLMLKEQQNASESTVNLNWLRNIIVALEAIVGEDK